MSLTLPLESKTSIPTFFKALAVLFNPIEPSLALVFKPVKLVIIVFKPLPTLEASCIVSCAPNA